MNSINVTEVKTVKTGGSSRCSYSVPHDAVKEALQQVKALIGSEMSQQAEIDECSEKYFHCIV